MNTDALNRVLVSNEHEVEQYRIVKRLLPDDYYPRRVLVGVRRAGKSYMLFQKMQERLAAGYGWDSMLYLNFEDERLSHFTVDDFDTILQCHAERYDKRPMLFLDEIQVVPGWERFARRLGDSQYEAWITGSNTKMLSSEIMTTLGGRYIMAEVYPYALTEYLDAKSVAYDKRARYVTESRAKIIRHADEYLLWGGLPESIHLPVKREYLSSTFQKIYLGDIAGRNNIANSDLLHLLLRKLADTVCKPVAYKRLEHALSSVQGRVSLPTIIKYIEQSEAAWLLLRLRNITASFSEKESACKYYFIDNGILNLFLIGGESALLENAVALALFRRYGHDLSHQRVYFYNDRVEVDFYIPDDRLAIQVCHSLHASTETYEREVDALRRLPKHLPCQRRLIITHHESETLTDPYGTIEVVPYWQWVLQSH